MNSFYVQAYRGNMRILTHRWRVFDYMPKGMGDADGIT